MTTEKWLLEGDGSVIGAYIHNFEHGIAGEIPFYLRSSSTGIRDLQVMECKPKPGRVKKY